MECKIKKYLHKIRGLTLKLTFVNVKDERVVDIIIK